MRGTSLNISTELSSPALAVSEFWKKGLSDPRVQRDLLEIVQSPGVRKLVVSGQINEAVAKVRDIRAENRVERREQIAVLLLSAEAKDWAKAVDIVEQNEDVREPKFFLTLAYRFWSARQLNRAIELGEKGQTLISDKDSALAPWFENSLAYYYADAERPDKEDVARRYAENGVKSRPGDPGPLDTLGFVTITYGKTKKEILQGVEYCNEARKLGGDFEMYGKHVARATERLRAYD
jgi:hypothetical protein